MKLFFSLLFLFLYASCGTEVGNPLAETEDDSNASPVPGNGGQEDEVDPGSALVREQACSKLVLCYPSHFDLITCRASINTVDGFDGAFALTEANYSNYTDIDTAVNNESISVSQTELTQCLTDINNLTCFDSEVVTAFDVNNANDFSQLYKIIPIGAGSCQDAFNEN